MEQAALDEAVRDIARQIIAEGVDAVSAFAAIAASASGMSRQIADMRARIAEPTGWRDLADLDAKPYASIDILMKAGMWVRGWWKPPAPGWGTSGSFWFWPTYDGNPLGAGGRPIMVAAPKAWRLPALDEQPRNAELSDERPRLSAEGESIIVSVGERA